MPRASWRGFLRLSLVSCPIYLSPATTRTKPIRLHQVWQPAPVDMDEDDLPDRGGARQGFAPSIRRLLADNGTADEDQTLAATRITLRPHDPGTGAEIDKREVLKGYEYSRGQFLTFTADELKALDVESTKIVDLEKFVAGDDIDPVYFDSPYYVYPDGPIAVETLRVIGAAMAEAGVVGLGRLTLSRRERMVVVEPRGTGVALFTFAPQRRFGQRNSATPRVTPMARWSPSPGRSSRSGPGVFDPSTYQDRYQEALRELIEAKMKGVAITPRAVNAPAPVIDLMAALKRSLLQEAPAKDGTAERQEKRTKARPDRRQPSLLLPVSGGRRRKRQPAAEHTTIATSRRKKA